MKSQTSVRLLLAVAVAAPLIAFWPDGEQDPQAEDWTKHVAKACESRRYGIRLAAARKVADGGDAAVPAIEAYAAENGRNALPSSLVDAIADGDQAGPKVSRLLWDWAMDPDFYWRSAAMRGLALRIASYREAGAKAGLEHDQVAYLMSVRAENDPAWLMRTHARFGLVLDGKPVAEVFSLPESDPRAPLRLATLLLAQGVVPPMQPLFDALADERTFLGSPWGNHRATEANKALRRWLGDAFPEFEPGDKQAAMAALEKVVEQKTGQDITVPALRTDRVEGITGGIEILSCKFGDQFVQWTDDGAVHLGLTGADKVQLPAAAWRELSKDTTAIALDQSLGDVICDSLRVYLPASGTNAKVAPGALPKPATDWLKRLAQTLEEAGETEVAADLRRGLGQFEGR